MCNAYRIGRELRAPNYWGADLLREIPTGDRLVRRTDPAPVVTSDLRLETMRWGFERPWGTVNNARRDKLGSPMWRAAVAERRCVVPATGFYEFTGPAGRKTAHWFHRADGSPIWFAGLYEPHAELGPCFSLVTTEPNSLVVPIHDRMPAVLEEEEIEPWLERGLEDFAVPTEALAVEEAPNPLIRARISGPPPSQGELFE